jgi:hypothetical protein
MFLRRRLSGSLRPAPLPVTPAAAPAAVSPTWVNVFTVEEYDYTRISPGPDLAYIISRPSAASCRRQLSSLALLAYTREMTESRGEKDHRTSNVHRRQHASTKPEELSWPKRT